MDTWHSLSVDYVVSNISGFIPAGNLYLVTETFLSCMNVFSGFKEAKAITGPSVNVVSVTARSVASIIFICSSTLGD